MEDRVPARSVGPVQLNDPLEEAPDHPQTVPLGVLGHSGAVGDRGRAGEPDLVVLDSSRRTLAMLSSPQGSGVFRECPHLS